MTSLYSTTVSPVKDGFSSPVFRPSNTGKPPLRALYDLLIAPMEGVCMCVCWQRYIFQFTVDLPFYSLLHQPVMVPVHMCLHRV